MPAKQDAVVCDGRGQQSRRNRGDEDVEQVQVPLRMVEFRELAGERQREQEPEQHLHSEARDAELLQQLGQVPVDALGFGLVAFVVADSGSSHDARLPTGNLDYPRPGSSER